MSEKTRIREIEAGIQTRSTDLPVRTLETSDIFGASKEIRIDHEGTIYRLKITRQNKLILNK